MKKRILVFLHAGGSPHHGPNMRWYYLGKALAPLGVEVEIVSSSKFHKYITPPVIEKAIETADVDGLTYHWLKTVGYTSGGFAQVVNQVSFALRCYQFFRFFLRRDADIVIASSPPPFVVFPARMVAKKSKAKFFFETRDLWPQLLQELIGLKNSHPYVLALRLAEKYGAKKSNRILTVKPGESEYFEKRYNIPGHKCVYIPNGFLPYSSELSVPNPLRSIKSDFHFLVGYVGGLSTYYGLDRLIELAEKVKGDNEVAFVIYGKGSELGRLRSKVEHAKLKNVFFMGAVEKSVVPSLLSMFDVCYVGLETLEVHKYGISCNKIFEYMEAGKPIIGSYECKYDPIEDAQCGFTAPPDRYEPLVAAIYQLKEDPALRARMGERGKAYFRDKHDFRVVATKLVDTLLEENQGSSGVSNVPSRSR